MKVGDLVSSIISHGLVSLLQQGLYATVWVIRAHTNWRAGKFLPRTCLTWNLSMKVGDLVKARGLPQDFMESSTK